MSSGQARGAAAARSSSARAASKAPGARSGAKPHGSALSLLPATLPASRLPPVNVFVNFSDSSFSSPCWGKRYISYNPCVVLLFWQLVFFHLVKLGSRGCFKDKYWLVLLKIHRDIYIFCLSTIDTKITCTLIFVYCFFVCLIGSQTYNISPLRSYGGLLRFLFGYMSWVAIIH